MIKTKENNAITLMTLIITVVVLLILSTVAINSITQDDIIDHAENITQTYANMVNSENALLKNHIGTLTGDSSNTDDNEALERVYKVGDLVKARGELFYVIEDCGIEDTSILLLTRTCINTKTLAQETEIDEVAFSKTNYWATIEDIEYPYDLIETGVPDETHYAARAAYDYGIKLGGKGRLLKYSEVEELKDKNRDMIFSKDFPLHYWVSRAENEEWVWLVLSTYNGIFNCDEYMINFYMGVRPVVEISKDKVSPYVNN